jgi:hypothetical protein
MVVGMIKKSEETGMAAVGDPSGMLSNLQGIATVHIGPR